MILKGKHLVFCVCVCACVCVCTNTTLYTYTDYIKIILEHMIDTIKSLLSLTKLITAGQSADIALHTCIGCMSIRLIYTMCSTCMLYVIILWVEIMHFGSETLHCNQYAEFQ